MTETLRAGVTVKLKSGGPLMAVTEVWAKNARPLESMCRCQWFDGTKLETGEFHGNTLEVVAAPK